VSRLPRRQSDSLPAITPSFPFPQRTVWLAGPRSQLLGPSRSISWSLHSTSTATPSSSSAGALITSLVACLQPRCASLYLGIFSESAIRNCDNFQVTKADVEKILDWKTSCRRQNVEIPFKPARVLLQADRVAAAAGGGRAVLL